MSFPISFLVEYSECVNPQRQRGQCVPIQLCEYVLNIARYSQVSREAQYFLSQSQCGYNQFTSFVCCPQTTQTNIQPTPNPNQPKSPNLQQQSQYQQVNGKSVYQKNPQRRLPKHPQCGIDVQDRIIGGTETTIYEFPWFALLKYSKGSKAYRATRSQMIIRFFHSQQLGSQVHFFRVEQL
jgi:Regulatory CLIP domain of proteinases